MTRIDAHAHIWRLDRGDYDWMSPERGRLYRDYLISDLEAALGAHGFDEVVLIQAAGSVDETRFMLECAAQSSAVAAVIGWADLGDPNVDQTLEALARAPLFCGVRPMLIYMADDDWLSTPAVARGLDALCEMGLVLEFLGAPRHLQRLHHVAACRPELRVMIDHCAYPTPGAWRVEGWRTWMARLADETRAYCKVSGLTPVFASDAWAEMTEVLNCALEWFGPERLVFGGDWPVVGEGCGYALWIEFVEQWARTHAPGHEAALFGGNAARFYAPPRGDVV